MLAGDLGRNGAGVRRVKVYFTVDVEIWPGAWTDIDARFPAAFRHYVYGDTPFGQYGLPFTLNVLRDHGLRGVFFVEPVFSARFGLEPLAEVVGLIRDAGQDVQMHLHAEWVNEAREPLLAAPPREKVQHLAHFGLEDQKTLLAWSMRRLVAAGADPVTAFRAGSFAFNGDTLTALAANGVGIDSSYNECCLGPESGVWDTAQSGVPIQPFTVGGVLEVPVTIYRDRPGHLRPMQLTACSLREMLTVLNRAADAGQETVMIVSHNFEMLDRRDFSRDEIVAERFRGLCRFLSRNSDRFETATFRDVAPSAHARQPAMVEGSLPGLAVRYLEQARREYRILR